MKRFFERLSIANKLVLINLVVVITALISAFTFFFISERSEHRAQIIQSLQLQSQMMAKALAPYLVNSNQQAASELLSSYALDESISEVILFDSNRNVLAYYNKWAKPLAETDYAYLYGGRLQWPGDEKSSVVFSRHGIFVFQEIADGGGLFILSSLDRVNQHKNQSFWVLVSVFFVALLVSLLVIRRMIVLITEPINRLLGAVKTVHDEGSYAVRVNQYAHDELGDLSEAFNNMLQAIGDRDSELSKQHLKLEAEVQERTHEIRVTNENLEKTITALQQANRAIRISEENKRIAEASARSKAHFLANMSHELRTPMNGVLGMLSLLNDTELNEEQREYLGVAYESGHVLLDLINNVLDLSKIEQGKLVLESIGFDVRTCVEEVFSIVAESAQIKSLELALDWTPSTPTQVLGDPVRFKQLILNLVGNAIKFTEHGHILVMFRIVGDFGARKRYRFEVCDTGVGIKEDVRDLIFEKFSQADASTTRQFGGTGLGLALCKQLTRLMDGTIGVQSEVGKGSNFWFEVFFQEQPDAEPHPRLEPSAKRFLLLEPSRASQSSFASYFGAMGAKLDAVSDLESFVGQIESEQQEYYGVIMSLNAGVDVIRPMLNASLLRSRFSKHQILVTGTAQQRQKLAAEERLQHSYITKPLRYERFYEALTAAIYDRNLNVSTVNQEYNVVPLGNYRVLVVEDNEVNQQVARGRLERMGYDVHVAENGAAALELLNREQYDLIFMDCQMPVLDGYQATRRIRQDEKSTPSNHRTPIVAMTAHALAGDRDQCLKAGMDDYVSKPFKTEELKLVLERWLRC
jgi:signal transduction histidine kinase/CheY-like chemotaxis protein